MEYIDLHIHTEFTKGNGVTKIPELVKRAKEFKMDALAIVDSGNIDGFTEFEVECKKEGIKPIFGCGFYFAPLGLMLKETNHLVLIAKNSMGYSNLLKLVDFSNNYGKSSKPRIDLSILKLHSDGLIALSGGLGGIFDKPFIAGNTNIAKDNVIHLLKIFGDDLYLELQDNETEFNKLIIPHIVELSKKLGIKIVVSGGSFYLNREDYITCNSVRREFGNKELEGSGYFFKSPLQMNEIFKDYRDGITNSRVIADSIDNLII